MYYQISVADLGVVDPDPTFKKKRDPDPTFKKITYPDPTLEKHLEPTESGLKIRLLGIEGFIDGLRLVSVATQSEIEGCV